MATGIKEVVVNAKAVTAEYFTPECSHLAFSGGSRRYKFDGGLDVLWTRQRQRFAVDLSVRR